MVRNDVAGAGEPEVRNLVEHAPLVRNGVWQHHIERREPVGGDDEHALRIHFVDVAHFAFVDALEAAQGGPVNGGRGHVYGWTRAGERAW
jgi:hypothetical protein